MRKMFWYPAAGNWCLELTCILCGQIHHRIPQLVPSAHRKESLRGGVVGRNIPDEEPLLLESRAAADRGCRGCAACRTPPLGSPARRRLLQLFLFFTVIRNTTL